MSAANEIAARAPACAPAKKKQPEHGEHKRPKHKHHGPHGDD
jgi:hypothetical protein